MRAGAEAEQTLSGGSRLCSPSERRGTSERSKSSDSRSERADAARSSEARARERSVCMLDDAEELARSFPRCHFFLWRRRAAAAANTAHRARAGGDVRRGGDGDLLLRVLKRVASAEEAKRPNLLQRSALNLRATISHALIQRPASPGSRPRAARDLCC